MNVGGEVVSGHLERQRLVVDASARLQGGGGVRVAERTGDPQRSPCCCGTRSWSQAVRRSRRNPVAALRCASRARCRVPGTLGRAKNRSRRFGVPRNRWRLCRCCRPVLRQPRHRSSASTTRVTARRGCASGTAGRCAPCRVTSRRSTAGRTASCRDRGFRRRPDGPTPPPRRRRWAPTRRMASPP